MHWNGGALSLPWWWGEGKYAGRLMVPFWIHGLSRPFFFTNK